MSLCVIWIFIYILVVKSISARSGGGHISHPHGSGGRAHYPASSGYSGSGSGSNVHDYPHSPGLSGSHSQDHRTDNYFQAERAYTQTGHKPEYNNARRTETHPGHQAGYRTENNYGHKTEVHHHYHYNPPPHVTYGSISYPVYHERPPVYVYEYRDSGSRFDMLLTGLALYNLGKLSANHNHDHYNTYKDYSSRSGEICKLGISKDNGDYEETRIDCKLMSSFIWDVEKEQSKPIATRTVTTTVVNTTQVNVSRSDMVNANNTVIAGSITITNTTVIEALQSKGASIKVTPKMTCFLKRISRDSSFVERKIECGVLQAYARSSLHYNSANHLKPVIIILLPLVYFFL